METELVNYVMTNSIRGLALLATINVAGFISSFEDVKISGISRETDEFKYDWTILDKAIGVISKPGRSLAYLISGK